MTRREKSGEKRSGRQGKGGEVFPKEESFGQKKMPGAFWRTLGIAELETRKGVVISKEGRLPLLSKRRVQRIKEKNVKKNHSRGRKHFTKDRHPLLDTKRTSRPTQEETPANHLP